MNEESYERLTVRKNEQAIKLFFAFLKKFVTLLWSINEKIDTDGKLEPSREIKK